MNILIKATQDTYNTLQKGFISCHCAQYYTFLFKDIFTKLGHNVKFYGKTILDSDITNNFEGYDCIIFWGLESFIADKEFSEQILKNFKGKKILYITAQVTDEIIKHFNYIFATEMEFYKDSYNKNFPNIKTYIIPFCAPLYDFVDKNIKNPYIEKKFKIIYTGIITDRYLRILNNLAQHGENIYIGGIYKKDGEIYCRHFKPEEIKTIIHKKIKLITPEVNFIYGYHFNYLKYASVGLNFFPCPEGKSRPINSKIIDYLICGLPIISEEFAPNNYRITDLKAGIIVKWNDFNSLLKAIEKEKKTTRDRQSIQKEARKIFNALEIGKQIINIIK